ncbi:MAG: cobamide remodeling phosphodiesterase CbiR, partial [Desulfosarcina sp.]
MNPSQPFPPLDCSCKDVFPFRLACPSFVYRADYADNVRCLAPFVDEIELLFFESRFPDSLPSSTLIRELVQLARQGGISYNIHLPTDIHAGHPHDAVRHAAVAILEKFIDRCKPLDPSSFTLHLNRKHCDPDPAGWQTRTAETLAAVLADRLAGRRISVENIGYDFALAVPVVEGLDLSVCMD